MDVEKLKKLVDANPERAKAIEAATGLRFASRLSQLPRLTRPPLIDSEAMARLNAKTAEAFVAPIITRDAILALLEETRKNARRERWILLIAAASFVVSLVAVLAALT